MADIPDTISGKIQYFQQRLPVWAADPAAIGLTSAQIADLQTTLTVAGNAFSTVQQIRQQAKNETANQNAAVGELMTLGTGLIAMIRAYAELSGDPDQVFTTAEIDPTSNSRSPRPAPVPAENLTTTLQNSGAVKLTWKGTVAFGTYYDVYRKFEGESNFTLIGSASKKFFEDTGVPAGTTGVSYYLVTNRDGQSSGQSETVTMRFGMSVQPGTNTNTGENSGGLSLAA